MSMEPRLQTIFANVNDWLKFAEAKNAAVLAATGGACFASAQLLFGEARLTSWAEAYLCEFVAFSALACAIALVSFIPQVGLLPLLTIAPPSDQDNLLFFGHINKYGSKHYLLAMYDRTDEDPSSSSRIEEAYAEQIVVNSRIALRKYRMFNSSVWCVLAAVLTLPGAVACWLLLKAAEHFAPSQP